MCFRKEKVLMALILRKSDGTKFAVYRTASFRERFNLEKVEQEEGGKVSQIVFLEKSREFWHYLYHPNR